MLLTVFCTPFFVSSEFFGQIPSTEHFLATSRRLDRATSLIPEIVATSKTAEVATTDQILAIPPSKLVTNRMLPNLDSVGNCHCMFRRSLC